ncbi:MAG: polysaccharide biosynthesis C-terminal domain-containing protein [Gammaproteobacteria bacterium]|nr:polysaccharide biosynthesis C-terminal domain-containing protein [Gammaproteobacteria bacterium]
MRQIIIQHTDTLMIGVLKSASETGIYHVVSQIAMLVAFMLTAINMVIAPHIARFYESGEFIKLQELVSGGARVAILGAIPFMLVFIFFGYGILAIVFGNEFTTGYTALWILCLGQFFNVAMGSVGLILNMTGHAWYSSAGVAIAALANIVLNALLIPPFGMIGAAVATAISLLIWNILLCWWVYRLTGLVSLAYLRGRK